MLNRLLTPVAMGALSLSLTLTACGETPGADKAVGGAGEIKALAACAKNPSDGPMRETFLLVDAKALVRTDKAVETAQKNGWLRDLFVDVADPVKALASGFVAPNELVTIIVLSSDGASGTRVFTGCVPGAASNVPNASGKSSVGAFFTGSDSDALKEQQDQFRTRLIGGLQAAAAKGDQAASRQTGPLAASKLFESIRNSRGLFESGTAAKRFVIVSDLSGIDGPAGEAPDAHANGAFEAGVTEGYRSAFDFELGEVYLVQPEGTNVPDRAFLDGFFLAQSAELVSAATGRVGPGSLAPVSVETFKGNALYPSGAQPLTLRLARDAKDQLVASWLVLLGDHPQSLPLAGTMQCATADECTVTSKNGKFSQSWSPAPGGEPEFDDKMPFGGMRDFKLEIKNGKLMGSVSDAYVGDVGNGKNFIGIEAAKARGGQ